MKIVWNKAMTLRSLLEDSEKPVLVLDDRKMLDCILQNLISNSVGHSCGGVEFSLQTENDIWLHGRNPVKTGVDMDTGQLFDKFYKVSQGQNPQGAGLGPAIVKLLAEKQQEGSVNRLNTVGNSVVYGRERWKSERLWLQGPEGFWDQE